MYVYFFISGEMTSVSAPSILYIHVTEIIFLVLAYFVGYKWFKNLNESTDSIIYSWVMMCIYNLVLFNWINTMTFFALYSFFFLLNHPCYKL